MVTENVEVITPEEAQHIMDNKCPDFTNRGISPSHILEIIRQYQTKNWNTEVNPIIFDINDILIDGQHRLLALIKYGKPVSFLVKRGVSREGFKYLDQCKIRSAIDFGVIERKEDPRNCVPVFRWILNYNNTGVPTCIPRAIDKLSEYEVMEWGYESHPEVVDSINIIKGIKNSILIPIRIANYMHYCFSRKDKERATSYMQSILDLSKNTQYETEGLTRAKISKYISKARERHVGPRPLNEHIMVLLVLGWNRISAGSTELTQFSRIPECIKGSYLIK